MTRTYSTSDAAELIGCSERWLIDQLRASRFPGRKVARHWRLTEQDIRDTLDICLNDARGLDTCASRPLTGLTPTSRKKVVRQVIAGKRISEKAMTRGQNE